MQLVLRVLGSLLDALTQTLHVFAGALGRIAPRKKRGGTEQTCDGGERCKLTDETDGAVERLDHVALPWAFAQMEPRSHDSGECDEFVVNPVSSPELQADLVPYKVWKRYQPMRRLEYGYMNPFSSRRGVLPNGGSSTISKSGQFDED